jgi:hypothetical protein
MRLHRLEASREVAQRGRLLDDPISGKVSRVRRHLAAHRDDAVDVALSVLPTVLVIALFHTAIMPSGSVRNAASASRST